jgi:general secretion pathway protein I
VKLLRRAISHRSQRGFGLLEAIVALTVLGVTGAALFAWISQNLQTASRLQERGQRVQQQMLTEGLVSAVNPFATPSGQMEQGGLSITWTSELTAPLRPSLPFDITQQVRWQVGLYKMKVTSIDMRSGQAVQFEWLQTGLESMLSTAPKRPDTP